MSKTSDKRTTTLKVEKFSHSSHKPRSERWREWYSKLKFAFGAALPMIANQIGQQCDPTSHWWGLEWNSAFFDFDSMSADEEKKCWLEFQTAQYALMDVLSSNFATHEKQIIADHDPLVLTEKVIRQYSEMWDSKLTFFPIKAGWTPTTWMTTWLPFGYLCLHAISLKYDDTGVTDAISKYDAFVSATKFNPSNLNQWVSHIESTWSEWKNAATNPEHMAAVQLTREILQSDNEDWRSWALNFTTTQGDKPYSVADLMEKIVSQDKLRTAGGKPKKESALLAIKDGKARFKKKVTKPKICGNKACSNKVRYPLFRFCNSCYKAHKKKSEPNEDSAALASVPDNVREQTREKALRKLKKKMAQMHNAKKSGRRDVLLAEADALLATAMGTSKTKDKVMHSDDEEADVLDTSPSPTASAPVTKPKKPNTSAKHRFGKLSLMKAFKAKPGAMQKAHKEAKAAIKSSDNKDSHQALLAGCTVQRFAGYVPPPVFGQK
jgi:hypothetical protein